MQLTNFQLIINYRPFGNLKQLNFYKQKFYVTIESRLLVKLSLNTGNCMR